MRTLAALLLLATPALAEPPPGVDVNSAAHRWFENQHSVTGAWCCDVADGILLNDNEWRQADGGYQVRLDGAWLAVPSDAMRDPHGGPNITGRAIVWHRGATIYCFAPGFEY